MDHIPEGWLVPAHLHHEAALRQVDVEDGPGLPLTPWDGVEPQVPLGVPDSISDREWFPEEILRVNLSPIHCHEDAPVRPVPNFQDGAPEPHWVPEPDPLSYGQRRERQRPDSSRDAVALF